MTTYTPSQALLDRLTLEEGVVLHPYRDSLGYWTIGIGHLITKNHDLPENQPPQITRDEAQALLRTDLAETAQSLQVGLPWALAAIGPIRWEVLVDMAFNLGVPGLLKWKNTLEMIKDGKFDEAARAMETSLWAKQVKGRATRLAQIMRTGELPNG